MLLVAMKNKAKVKPSFLKKNTPLLLFAILASGILIGMAGIWVYGLLSTPKEAADPLESQKKTSQGYTPTPSTDSLPENFPKDFPIYPSSTLKTSWAAQGETKQGISVLWESEESAQVVTAFYKQELARLGFRINSSFESEGSFTISFEKEDVSGFIGIAQGDGAKTQISVTLGIPMVGI